MILAWVKFFICSGLIVYSGIYASKYGDMIAEKTGLSRSWIGILLLASMTSLPELMTGASSILLASVPNIAVGTIFGSAVFNLTIIALMDLYSKDGPVLKIGHSNHIIAAGCGIILILVSALALILHNQAEFFQIGWISITTPIIIILYLVSMKIIFRIEKHTHIVEAKELLKYEHIPTKTVYQKFALHALLIMAVSTWLPFIGDELALLTGWGNTFFGTIFIAFSTSLPEIVISLTALKIGAVDMALGGILGSNLFNFSILAIDDILYTDGPIYSDVSATHILPALTSILMSALVMICLYQKPKLKSLLRLNWFNLIFFSLFFLTVYVVFQLEQ